MRIYKRISTIVDISDVPKETLFIKVRMSTAVDAVVLMAVTEFIRVKNVYYPGLSSTTYAWTIFIKIKNAYYCRHKNEYSSN